MVGRGNFENSLKQLQDKMAEMGDLAAESMEKAFQAFSTHDVELALKVIEEDEEIDDLEIEINQFAIWLTTKEQPVARDLRRIIGVIKISSEIERVADFSVNIAKATIKIANSKSLLDLTCIEKMKEQAIQMLKKALESFIEEEISLAKEVGDMDDVVDDCSTENYKKLTAYLKEHPEHTDQLLQLLFVNRYLERTADHITNIAESAAFLIKGKIYDLNS